MPRSTDMRAATFFWPMTKGWNGCISFSSASRVSSRRTLPLGVTRMLSNPDSIQFWKLCQPQEVCICGAQVTVSGCMPYLWRSSQDCTKLSLPPDPGTRQS